MKLDFPDNLRITNPELRSLFKKLEKRNGKPLDRKGIIGDLMVACNFTQEEAEAEAIEIMKIELELHP